MENEATILICALRYALGRRTYVVGTVVSAIHNAWNRGVLSDCDKEVIVRDILEHNEKFGNLGHDIDKKEWMTIVGRHTLESGLITRKD